MYKRKNINLKLKPLKIKFADYSKDPCSLPPKYSKIRSYLFLGNCQSSLDLNFLRNITLL